MDLLLSSNALTALALAMITLGAGGLGFMGIRQARIAMQRRARLSDTGGGVAAAGAPPPAGGLAALSGIAGGVRRLGDRVEGQDPTQLSALRNKLMQAGFVSKEAVAYYLGARTIALIAATAAVVLLMPFAFSKSAMLAVVMAAVFALIAIMAPDQFIRMRRTAREREYREGFPDVLDLLVASVQAGLSLDAAVSRIAEELASRYPNLTEHLVLMTLELRAGRARKEAWSRLAERLGIEEAYSFATMLRQAEDMGTSLGDTLTAFSEDMRAKRILRAEELANSLPAKLMLPLILFIFPCLMGVLILPAAVHIAQAMGHK
ncbi:MAG TPA: type II secretion system F family protein [Caulobacteraceae bacterium]|nr:type II secretion system F family protein [Caulobacteraceae bacterium]